MIKDIEMTIKKLFLLILSLGCCTAAAMEYKDLPLDVKKLILQDGLKGESFATILRRIDSWRTVSEEWDKILSNEQFLEKVFESSTFVRENDFTPVVHKYFARYLAQIVARGVQSPMEEELLALVLEEGEISLVDEVFKLILTNSQEHSAATSTDDKFTLFTYTSMLHALFRDFAFYGLVTCRFDAFLKEDILNCSQRCGNDLWEIACLARRVANGLENSECSVLISKMSYFIKNPNKSCVSYGDIAKEIYLKLEGDNLSLIKFINSDTAFFIETLKNVSEFNAEEKAFLKGAAEGDCVNLLLWSEAKTKPALVDLALAIALKAGHEKYVLQLLKVNLEKRPVDAGSCILMNNCLAIRCSDEISVAIGNYYKDSCVLSYKHIGSACMLLGMLCARSSEEMVRLCTLLDTYSCLDEKIRDWLLSYNNNDIEQMRTILKSEDFTGSSKAYMLHITFCAASINSKYDILKVILEDEFAQDILRGILPVMKPIIDKDPKLQELFSPFK